MILAGLVIALGAVVDDAIIDVENIVRRLRQHRRAGGSRASTGSVILEASLEVRSPIVFATLIIVAAAIPVFLLQGLTGAFFRPLALSYTLAIVASMVVAMTLTPALTLILLRNTPIERRESPVVRVLQRGYTALLARVVRRPAADLRRRRSPSPRSGSRIAPTLGQSLFPHFKEPDFLIHWVTQPGTSAAEMERTTQRRSARRCAQIPGLRNFGAHIGQAFLGEEVAGVNLGENWVSIDPSVDYDDDAAGASRTSPTSTRACSARRRPTSTSASRRSSPAARSPSSSASSAPDLTRAARQGRGDQQASWPASTAWWTTTSTSPRDVPQLQVEVDLAKAAQYRLKPGDVRRAAATLRRRRGGRRHLPRRAGLRHRGVERPAGPGQRRRRPRT